jgi:hypothetical protein
MPEPAQARNPEDPKRPDRSSTMIAAQAELAVKVGKHKRQDERQHGHPQKPVSDAAMVFQIISRAVAESHQHVNIGQV